MLTERVLEVMSVGLETLTLKKGTRTSDFSNEMSPIRSRSPTTQTPYIPQGHKLQPSPLSSGGSFRETRALREKGLVAGGPLRGGV